MYISNVLENNLSSIDISKSDINIIKEYAAKNSICFDTIRDVITKKFLVESSDFNGGSRETYIYHDARLSKKTKMFLRSIIGIENHSNLFAIDEGHLKAIFFAATREIKNDFKITMQKFWKNKTLSESFHQILRRELKESKDKDALLRLSCKIHFYHKNVARTFFKKYSMSPFYKRKRTLSQDIIGRKFIIDDQCFVNSRPNLTKEIDNPHVYEKEKSSTNYFIYSNEVGLNRSGDFKTRHIALKKFNSSFYNEVIGGRHNISDGFNFFDDEELFAETDCESIEYYGGYPTHIEYSLDILYESKSLMVSKLSLTNQINKRNYNVNKYKYVFENMHNYYFSSFEKTQFEAEKINLLKVFLEEYMELCNDCLGKCYKSFYNDLDYNLNAKRSKSDKCIESGFGRGLQFFLSKYKKFLNSNKLCYLNFIKFHYLVFKKKIYGSCLETINENGKELEIVNYSNDSGYFDYSFSSHDTQSLEEEMWE